MRRKEAKPNFSAWRGDHRKTRERSASMHAGEYDLSPTTNRRFQAWCEAWAREVLRVLKPGGHAVVFGSPRTFHRLTCGLEDAGFEIRDTLMWLFGSGFPKSLNVSKAIDRTAAGRGTRDAQADPAGIAPSTPAAAPWAGWGTALKASSARRNTS